ncbi:SGNH/GDSL hydrolase family protein [Pseudoduganella sp. SL102]|uniref:SGNH/GDSL hydrolase family protein n=1 Tax=Pseudoduganella sp. SL102 TaxID=2995154 RepID=UPI00248D13EC|nr:SGNH/GDSL hydrolase family protein [Pseudoduganella sp. SL102]WBS01049.1 SGNH/GDSL hydrolase family protein [Pseudoduganella sp. SL102]
MKTPHLPARRRLISATLAAAVAMAALAGMPLAHGAPAAGQDWIATWGTAPADAPPKTPQTFTNQTVRMIVHTSIGGSRVRVRLSNELGAGPLRIGAAHVALRAQGADIAATSNRALTFGGRPSVVIPPGAPVLSDPVDLAVPAQADLAVSLHLPDQAQATTVHSNAFQTSYVSGPGNFAGAAAFPTRGTITSWPFLTAVDVTAAGAGTIVALGDSITDGSNTTADSNRRWPDVLARRLQAERPDVRFGIVNRGIGGNRLLRDPGEWPPFGRAVLARFDRDVLATAGVRHVVLLVGINDIGHPGTGGMPASDGPTADDLIAGYRQAIARARTHGIAVHGATLTPFEGTTFAGYYTAQKDAVRQAVNRWIRESGEFDSVIDFDRALRDPAQPSRLLAKYDSGDHLHPNDAGMAAMAAAVPLELFSRAAAAPR